jgi:hypothetical protein
MESTKNTTRDSEEKYASQKKYFKSKSGRKALRRARRAYDDRDPERRKKQKRDYMRRKRRGNLDKK